MLRAIGAQIEKTTNKEACRDLSGRRIRDVNIERRFKNWVTKAAERKKEQMKKKKERLERLRRVPKFEFKDDEYFKVRSEMPDKIDAALDYALQKNKNRPTTAVSATVTSDNNPGTSSSTQMKNEKVERPMKSKHLMKLGLAKRSRMWVGDDLEVSDEDTTELSEQCQDEDRKYEKVVEDASLRSDVITALHGVEMNAEIPEHDPELEIASPLKEVPVEPLEVLPAKIANEPQQLIIENFVSKEELVALGLDRLMSALKFLGMKCGGTLEQRADRLWSVRGLETSQIPKNLLAPKSKK